MQVQGTESLPSPALLFDEEAILSNLDRMVEIVKGDVSRLRPHLKTHKCAEILTLQLERGIDRAKCATTAEAELAASTGIHDVLLSYPAIGPTAKRLHELTLEFPDTQFSTLIDSEEGLRELEGLKNSRLTILLDLNIGMSRTGIVPGMEATLLIQQIVESPFLRWGGIHSYDGHIHNSDPDKRKTDFDEAEECLSEFVQVLEGSGIPVPLIVSGGSPTFALHAAKAVSSGRPWECSPGTTLLWDAGYGEKYQELGFRSAAFLLARVVSHPGKDIACLDLGHKAVSAENPIENRIRFPNLPDHHFVSQSEEHLVLRFPNEVLPPIGTTTIGIPYHVCPTVALYEEASIARNHKLCGECWKIAARNRKRTT